MQKAKRYLQQIRNAKLKILELEDKAEELRFSLMVQGVSYDKDRVQTTPEDRLANVFSKLLELEEAIYKQNAFINKIRNQILNLGGNYSKVLLIVYLDGHPLIEASRRLNYSYDYVKHLHQDALRKFEDIYEV